MSSKRFVRPQQPFRHSRPRTVQGRPWRPGRSRNRQQPCRIHHRPAGRPCDDLAAACPGAGVVAFPLRQVCAGQVDTRRRANLLAVVRPSRRGCQIARPRFCPYGDVGGLETRAQPDGATFISFGLIETDTTRAQWPHPSSTQLRVTVGTELNVELVHTTPVARHSRSARRSTPISTSAMWPTWRSAVSRAAPTWTRWAEAPRARPRRGPS